MEIIQSRTQNIKSRFYSLFINLIWFVLSSIIPLLIFSIELDLLLYLKFTIGLTASLTLYLWLVHPKPSKKIVFNATGFEFYDYQQKREVKWAEYMNYKVTKLPQHTITIAIHQQENIVIGYQVFSSKQRQQLFSALDHHRKK